MFSRRKLAYDIMLGTRRSSKQGAVLIPRTRRSSKQGAVITSNSDNGEASDSEEYIVEAIVGHGKSKGVMYYTVTWEGYPGEKTKLPESELESASEILAEYKRKHIDNPKTPTTRAQYTPKTKVQKLPSPPDDDREVGEGPLNAIISHYRTDDGKLFYKVKFLDCGDEVFDLDAYELRHHKDALNAYNKKKHLSEPTPLDVLGLTNTTFTAKRGRGAVKESSTVNTPKTTSKTAKTSTSAERVRTVLPDSTPVAVAKPRTEIRSRRSLNGSVNKDLEVDGTPSKTSRSLKRKSASPVADKERESVSTLADNKSKENGEEYEVESIVDHEELIRGRYIFTVTWVGYPGELSSLPEKEFGNASDILKAYKRKHNLITDITAAKKLDEDDSPKKKKMTAKEFGIGKGLEIESIDAFAHDGSGKSVRVTYRHPVPREHKAVERVPTSIIRKAAPDMLFDLYDDILDTYVGDLEPESENEDGAE